ncbi:MAG: DUF3846 domain-containing protein [Desulfosporosinus sp.]|nr:DUF3846 domain-containing protein [Desulfosporosinus sp.]
MLRVVVIEPGLPAKIQEVNNDSASFQSKVGGYIEHVPFFKDDIGFLFNEEGKLIGLPPNRINYYGDILVLKASWFLYFRSLELQLPTPSASTRPVRLLINIG